MKHHIDGYYVLVHNVAKIIIFKKVFFDGLLKELYCGHIIIFIDVVFNNLM